MIIGANMSKSTNDSQNINNSSTDKFTGSALDKAFPSPVLMGVFILLAIILTIYNGIKVVNIDRQERAIINERKIMASEKERHDKIKIALPQLEVENEKNESKRIDLLSKVTAEQHKLYDLTDKVRSGTDQLDKARAEYSEVKANVDIARDNFADLTNKSLDTRKQLTRNQDDVEISNKRMESLSSDITQLERVKESKRDEITKLNGQIEVLKIINEELNSQKQSLIIEIDKYVSDRGKLVELAQKVDSVVVTLEKSAEKSDSVVQKLDNQSMNLSLATGNLESETKKISNVSGNIENRNKDLINTNKKLDSSAISLQTASDSIQGQASKLATIAEDTAKLQIIISDIENTVQTFQADLLTLGSAMNRFNELTSKFEISTESIFRIQSSFDGNLNSLQTSINNSQSQIEQNSKDLMTSLTDLGKEISPISKHLSGLEKELKSLRKSFEKIDKTPPAKK